MEGGTLSSTQINQVVPFTSNDVTDNDNEKVQTICNLCRRMGLTWEGVYDGDVCVGISKIKKSDVAAAAAESTCS